MRRLSLVAIAAVAVAACSPAPARGPGPTAPPTTFVAPPVTPGGRARLRAELAAEGFDPITAIRALPGDDRLYVVEKTGRIRILDGTVVRPEPFVDLRDVVGSDGAEQGLLGLAFHPDFPRDPRAFVTLTDRAGDLHVVALRADRDRANPRILQDVLVVPQPHEYHQGGSLAFGPDGYLWAGFGDGGFIGDPTRNGQDRSNLLGTIVRIDVDAAAPYAIPPDNPFVDTPGARGEIWSYGLRNPWRFAFTPGGGAVVIADVGQDAYEEIDVARLDQPGTNFGWSDMEGPDCFNAHPCDPAASTPPALALPHDGLCALIGGPVYHGAAMPERFGHYFYGDFCVGWLRSVPVGDDGRLGPVMNWSGMLGTLGHLTTIDTDGGGELVVGNLEGAVYRLAPMRKP